MGKEKQFVCLFCFGGCDGGVSVSLFVSFLAFPCLCQCQYGASSVEFRFASNGGQTVVVVMLVRLQQKKKKDRTESCMLYFVLVVSVFGSVPLLASVDGVSEIVRSLQ